MVKYNSRFRNFLELLSKAFYMFIRDKQATIMIFVSPIAFMLILGFVIAGISGGTTSVNVKIATYISNSSGYTSIFNKVAKKSGIEPIFVKHKEDVKKLVNSGKAQMGIALDASNITFFYNQSFGQYNNYLKDLQAFIAQDINEEISGIPMYLQIIPESLKTGSSLTVISFIVPGVLAIAIMMAGVFGMATTLGSYRENGSLRRLRTTPLNGSLFVFSLALNRFWSSLLSSYVTVLVSEWIFSTNYDINWFSFTLLMASAVFMSLGFGTVFSVVFKDLWTILNFSTIILVIMMLFSNVFYPFSIMPEYMRQIAHVMPVTYFAQGLRYTLGIAPIHLWRFAFINVIFAFGGLLMILLGGNAIFYLEKR